MTDVARPQTAVVGWMGFATGACALVLTIAIFWAGPFAPQQSVDVTLGELAADIAKAAARSVAGQPQPAPVAPEKDIDDYLQVLVGVLAAVAFILGLASFMRRERGQVAFSGIALGGLAIGFQLFTWTIMVIAGVVIIFGIMASLSETFGDIFGGLFGG